MAEGRVDLGIHDVKFDGEKLTEESSYASMQNLSARAQDRGPVDLGIHNVKLADQYMVVVDGRAVSGVLASQSLAESFILNLNEEDQTKARIVPATADGKQALFG
jgi:hypothetical protein